MAGWTDVQTALTNIQNDFAALATALGEVATQMSSDESNISALQTITEVTSNPSSTGLHTQIQNIEAELKSYDSVVFPYSS
jgi:hypothetical protein